MEKEYIILILKVGMEQYMQEILKMITEKEKESFIIKMEIDMKVNIIMIKETGGEYIIIVMGTEKWETILMGKKQESM